MKKTRLIVLSVAAIVPLALAIGIRKVRGSEPPGRLTVSADGLAVTDSVTGLMWQRATASYGNTPGPGSTCAALSLEGVSSGWRLPTVKELLSIVDYESATQPMIDTAAFPGTTGCTTSYWSNNTGPYAVNFCNGVIQNTNGNVYRCVISLSAVDAGP